MDRALRARDGRRRHRLRLPDALSRRSHERDRRRRRAAFPMPTMLDRGVARLRLSRPPIIAEFQSRRRFSSIASWLKKGADQRRAARSRARRSNRADSATARSIPAFQVRNIAANGEVWTGAGTATHAHFPAARPASPATTGRPRTCAARRSACRTAGSTTTPAATCPARPRPGYPAWHDVETPVAKAVGPVEAAVVNHHGNRDSTNAFFVATLRPRVWIIPVWSSDHPGHDVLDRMYSPRLYPGPRDVFATNMIEANKIVIGPLLDRLASVAGPHRDSRRTRRRNLPGDHSRRCRGDVSRPEDVWSDRLAIDRSAGCIMLTGTADEHSPPVPDQRAARRPRRGGRVQRRAAIAIHARAAATHTGTPGAPPTFGTGAGVGPRGDAGDVRRGGEADAGDDDAGRAAAGRRLVARDRWRRTSSGAPARARWRIAPTPTRRPRSGIRCCRASRRRPSRDRFVRSTADGAPLPSSDDAIAFAPVTQLSRWIESRQLTSERLTNIYLESHRAARPEDPLRHHADARSRARAREGGRRRDRRRQVPRPAARHPVRREGPARHRRASRPPTAPSPSATACRRPTPRSCAG